LPCIPRLGTSTPTLVVYVVAVLLYNQASKRSFKDMESKMEQNSGEIRSGEAMSIFGQSIDVRRPGRSRRRAANKVPSEFSTLKMKMMCCA
jgi:hypothetical protein